MTYNTVSVTGNNIFGNALGEVVNVSFAPQSYYFDTPANTQINAPVATATSNSSGVWTVSGIIDPTPDHSGMAWRLTVTDKSSGQVLYNAVVQVAYSNGSTQNWLSLAPPPAPANTATFLTASSLPTAAGQYLQSNAGGSGVLNYAYGMAPLNIKNFGADPTGVTDSTTAINNAITAATGVLAPATHSRACTNAIYIPTGTYKITSDLIMQSVQGCNFYGDGAELSILVASGTGFTNAAIVIDGSYSGRYHGFTLKGDGTEQVPSGIQLTWTTNAQRSTTGNRIENIRIRNLNFVKGLDMSGVGTRQVDGTKISNIVVGGLQTANAWSSSGNWQQGVAVGSGSFGNIYDFSMDRVDVSGCYYGIYNNVSSFCLVGSQPAGNYCDFYINPGAQSTITNVQSQNSGQLLIAPSNFSAIPNSFNDIQFKTSYLNSASGNPFITLAGGVWNFNNVNASNTQVSAVYTLATISIAGSSSSRPCVCNFSNLSLFGTRVSAFSPLTNAIINVSNYSNFNPTTGNYTYATGDVASYNQGAAWTTVGGPGNLPAVTYITATGNTTYTIPANTQTLDVMVVGGGAGGSSGALATSGNAGGGAGGAGGGVSKMQFAVAALTSPITVTVGGGGAGGAAVSSAGAGNSGVGGTATLFGSYMWAGGGKASSGGSATNSVAVTGGSGGVGTCVSGQAGSTVTTAATPTSATAQATGGGGAGGGVNSTAQNGAGCTATALGVSSNSSSGGVVGGATPTNGNAPAAQGDTAPGGGGGAAITGASTTAQNGADARANSGGGGGGGGACSGGTSSGAGGAGGSGFALIIAYYQ